MRFEWLVLVGFLLAFVGATIAFLGLFPAFVFTTTKYSRGYSESAFSSIRPGDSTETVVKSLGQPLGGATNEAGEVRWAYSREGWALWYNQRFVVMSNGLVIEKISRLFMAD